MPPPKLVTPPIANSILYEKRVILNNLKRRSITEKMVAISPLIPPPPPLPPPRPIF
jgi:hypothetical protein